jgi:protein gp37
MGAGCDHCFARGVVTRFPKGFGRTKDDAFTPMYHPNWTDKLAAIKKPSVIFVAPLGDLFHNDIGFNPLTSVFVMAQRCPQHTFLILTKRYSRMSYWTRNHPAVVGEVKNIWWGASVWNQESYGSAMIDLHAMPTGTNKWLSIEPLINPIVQPHHIKEFQQVIVGGESGAGARPMPLEWVRTIRDACADTKVPFYFKQYSSADKVYHDKDFIFGHWLPLLGGKSHWQLAWRKL